jgi:pilus assembly protein CpaB
MSSAARSANPDRSNRLIFIGAIVLALLAAVLVFVSLSKFGDSGDSSSSTTTFGSENVVVASQDIKAGTTISDDMLEIATLPKQGLIEGAITDRSGLSGLVVRYPLAKGEQLSAAKLGQTDKDKGLTAIIPNGKRAVAIEIDENTSVGGLIVAGDRVDVIAVLTSQTDQQQQKRAVTLLQDIEVLAVAQSTQKAVARLDKDGNPIQTDTAEGALATRPDNTDAKPKAKTITLAVEPEDAPLLALAQDEGKVWLSLRGFGDKDTPAIGPRTLPSP